MTITFDNIEPVEVEDLEVIGWQGDKLALAGNCGGKQCVWLMSEERAQRHFQAMERALDERD